MNIFHKLFRLLGIGSKKAKHLSTQDKIETGIIKFLGGDGSSMDNAILISGDMQNGNEGIEAEYIYLSMKLGEPNKDWEMGMQFLMHDENGTHYDKLNYKDLKTNKKLSLYFNISEFYGKSYETVK